MKTSVQRKPRTFLLLTLLLTFLAVQVSAQTVFINEIHYDDVSTDDGEGIEVAGPAGTDLTGWSLVLYNGSNGSVYNTINLSGTIPDQASGFGTIFSALPVNGLQNGGPDGVALVDNSAMLVQFLSYEGTMTGVGGAADGVLSTDIGVAENSSTVEGTSLQLGGTGAVYTDFVWEASAASTYDAINGNQSFGSPTPSVIINEVDSDTPSTDVEEFIELYDGGAGNTALDGLVVVLFNGSTDVSYRAIDLDGFTTDANGYFVIGNAGVANVSITIPSNGIQNGADAVALYLDDATTFPNGTAVTNTNLLDALVYDTNDGDDAGLLTLLNAGEAQINEDAGGDKDNESMQRIPNGDGGALNTSSYATATPTPGASNDVAQPVDLIINEVDADTPGTDVAEFIELYDGGVGNSSLDGFVVVLYNGSTDVTYNAIDLDGFTTDANGYFVIGNAGVANVSITISSNGLQNGADAVAIYQDDAANFPNGTAVTSTNLVDALVYDTDDADDAGLLALLNAGEAQINENAGGDKDNESMQRIPNGSGGALNTSSYATAAPTPGATNDVAQPTSIIINEVDADTPGTDTAEFLELYDGGAGNSPLDGLVVVLYNGSSDVSYNAIDLDGFTTDANGYFVIGNAAVPNVSIVLSSNGIQNGADAVALYQDDAASFPNGTAVTNTNLVDAFVYDTNDGDDAGLLPLLNAGQAQINEDGEGDKDNHSNQRFANGTGGALNTSTYVQAIPTPGAANTNVLEMVDLIINEVDADTPGSDTAEFIEFFDGGAGNSPLDGFVVVLYNGNGDTSYNAFDLDGQITNADGYFVIGNAAVANVDLVVSGNTLQNGADAVALYLGDATDFPNGTAVTTTNLVDALVYDTNDADDAGLLALLNVGEAQINEDELGDKDNHSLQRIPNGGGGNRNTSTYTQAAPSPGEENGVIVDPNPITIAAARATAEGVTVKVRGTVTASDQFNGPAFIQDATGGIAIFDSQLHGDGLFAIGDSVEVTATRAAFNDQVQLSAITNLVSFGLAANPIQPATITLNDLPNFAGQLVRIVDVTFPNPGDLLFGNSNFDLTDVSGTGQLRIDNDVEALVGLAQPETCAEAIGVVGRFLTAFQLLPRQGTDLSCAEPFVPSGDDLSIPKSETFDIATWNIEWFGDESNFPASDAEQRDSVLAIIEALEVDVLAVQEIADSALFRQLVDSLPGYDFMLSEAVSRPNDAGVKQQVGFIYNTATVSPTEFRPLLSSIHPLYNGGDASALATYPDPDPARFYASGRLPYLMVADVTINGVTETLHMVALHARANSGSDAQGRYDMRKFDVEVLKDSLDSQFGSTNLILLGDFNDDIDETVADIPSTISSYDVYIQDTANYNLATLPLSEAGFRSFVFRENMIDHVLLSRELDEEFLPSSPRVGYEFFDTDYSNTASDHLVVSVRLQFEDPLVFNESVGAEVVSYNPGTRRNGRPVFRWRANPNKALGHPYENFWYNFVSLGFGGDLTLKMSAPISNLPGNDLKVFESTSGFWRIPCSWYPEQAEVFASEDGVDFFSLGTGCLNEKFDLEVAGLRTAEYIRIVDISDRNVFRGNADGYDVDAVKAIDESGSEGLQMIAANASLNMENFAPNEEFSAELQVMQNPVQDVLRLSINVVDEEITTQLRVVSMQGDVIYSQQHSLFFGDNTIEINMAGKTKGFYLVKMDELEGGLNHVKKVIKH